MSMTDGPPDVESATDTSTRTSTVDDIEKDPPMTAAGLLDAAIERERSFAVSASSGPDSKRTGTVADATDAEVRLASFGVALTDRLPAHLILRLLDLFETDQGVLSPLGGDDDSLRVELPWRGCFLEPPSDRDGTTLARRRVTALPTDPDVVDGVLRLVAEMARALVHGADGVSVSLLRHGRLSTVAATDQTIMEMDADQYATGEGPCVDASVQGQRFHAGALANETRWPAFTPQARGLGINAILSSPLKAFNQPVGALNIYSRSPMAFDTADQATAAELARKASVILSDAGVGVTDDQMALRYHDALLGRRTITLAIGVVMEREGIDEDAAFSALLRLALYRGETLRARAETMVRSSNQPEVQAGTGPGV